MVRHAFVLTLGLVTAAAGCIVTTGPSRPAGQTARSCPPAHHWDGRACVHNGNANGNANGNGRRNSAASNGRRNGNANGNGRGNGNANGNGRGNGNANGNANGNSGR